MPNKPGERVGGRQLGAPNKSKQAVRDRLNELGVDPIHGMAMIAEEAYAMGDLLLAGTMYKELAQYTESKQKAITISGDEKQPITFTKIELVAPNIQEIGNAIEAEVIKKELEEMEEEERLEAEEDERKETLGLDKPKVIEMPLRNVTTNTNPT